MLARAQARKARREAKIAENAALAGESVVGSGNQTPSKSLKKGPPRDFQASNTRSGAPPRRKRRKKSLFVRLRDALDRECQAYAAERDRHLGCRIRRADKCTGQSQVGYHIIPRGRWNTRWNLDFRGIGNIVGACSPCNAGEKWHRLTYADYHREIFGQDFYEELNDLSKRDVKHSSLELQALLDRVRELRAKLKGA